MHSPKKNKKLNQTVIFLIEGYGVEGAIIQSKYTESEQIIK